ncbi:MAG: acyl carrier protein [Candidatus Aureabacteria bacterium]|nr:acyl carrier protein [Candidatus Auribacterota bacterium]
MEKFTKIIKEILVDEILIAIPEDQLTENDNLVKDLGLDSIQIMELIVILEKKFKFRFEDSDLNYKVFKDILSLANHLKKKLKK